MKNICIIIQARLGSTRLPNKILLPFSKDESIIDIIINKLKSINNVQLVLATSSSINDDKLVDVAKTHNIICYRGSENDVLQRFIDVAEFVGSNNLVRICSDNPFIQKESIEMLINEVHNMDYDYISFQVNNTPSIKTHFGFWAEYVSLNALKRISTLTSEKIYHEHVTNYIYTHPLDFKIKWLKADSILDERNDIRLTIDTINDFNNAKYIYKDLLTANQSMSIQNIVNYLDTHTQCLSVMKNEITNNTK